jgi:hypothetical protein
VVTLGRRRRWRYGVGAGGSVGGGREGSVGTVEGVFVCPIVSRCQWGARNLCVETSGWWPALQPLRR